MGLGSVRSLWRMCVSLIKLILILLFSVAVKWRKCLKRAIGSIRDIFLVRLSKRKGIDYQYQSFIGNYYLLWILLFEVNKYIHNLISLFLIPLYSVELKLLKIILELIKILLRIQFSRNNSPDIDYNNNKPAHNSIKSQHPHPLIDSFTAIFKTFARLI